MSAERPPEQRREFLVSPEKERNVYVGIIGATGSGKTELAEALKKAWGSNVWVIREVYPENPWLTRFYQEPKNYSFLSETFFLYHKIDQMRQVTRLRQFRIPIHDPAKWDDTDIYAHVHKEMGYMSHDEYDLYMRIGQTLIEAAEIPEPDVILATVASPEVVVQRIIERGREDEIDFKKRHPDYFPRLAERVVEWIDQNPHGVPIIPIDSERFNYVLNERDRNTVIGEIRAGLSYELFNPRGRNGVGRDGAKLVFPSILRPRHLSDVAPNSMKPGRVR